jgi:hypothetical protein
MPNACKPFLRLREGKLFLVETGRPEKWGHSKADGVFHARTVQPRIERFWLCDECASHWTLVHDREQGILLAPLRKPVASVPVAAEVSEKRAGFTLLKRVPLPVAANALRS